MSSCGQVSLATDLVFLLRVDHLVSRAIQAGLVGGGSGRAPPGAARLPRRARLAAVAQHLVCQLVTLLEAAQRHLSGLPPLLGLGLSPSYQHTNKGDKGQSSI